MGCKHHSSTGFSLIEVMVALAILASLSIGVLGMFQFALFVISENKVRTGAITIANDVIETSKNLPYNNVGTVNGIVPGSIPQTETVTLNSIEYGVESSVSYVDDPFDGTVEAGTDPLGNDYKQIRVAVSWVGRFGTRDIVAVTTVAPKGIESNEGQGVLWINVIDANGDPVSEASIRIVNNQTDPPIDDSSHRTNSLGYFYSSVPAADESYQIVVTKSGYSSDYNCAISPTGSGCSVTVGNPSPVKPRATVIVGTLTKISFAIDKVATLKIKTVSQVNTPEEWLINTDTSGKDQKIPALAIGANGNYYFAWQDFRNSAARIYSQDYAGQTGQWTPDVAITTSNNQSGPDLAVDRNNNVYFAWFSDRNGNQDIYFDKYDSNGIELWSGSKKVNTDQGSADQVYPKVILSATTTSDIEFIAWKDNRASASKSDIYLQKFDGNGNSSWPEEVKVNFNQSALYQTSGTKIWSFDNPAEYLCDGGDCAGTEEIQVTGGSAQLVSIKSCQGAATACSTRTTANDCLTQTPCTWDQTGPCSGGSCTCSSIIEQSSCTATNSCNWQAGTTGCSGSSCNCWNINSKNRCKSVSGCAWFMWYCYPTSGCNCTSISQSQTCTEAQCNWGSSGGSCSGSCTCANLTTEPVCSAAICAWDQAGPCEGTPAGCGTFSDQTSCEGQNGCLWTESGAGYPTDKPNIYVIQSLSVSDLISWDSITETATKNGGEIYYQLSDDDGATWQYWSGTAWVAAGASNYNTAAVINTAIAQFPKTNQKIAFKAFLGSNGSQQVVLDGLQLDYSYTTSGGNYSQSVDLAADPDDNTYVTWETYDVDNYDVFLQKVSTSGSVIWTNDIMVSKNTSGDQTNSTIVTGKNNYIYLAWQDNNSGSSRIYLQKFDYDGQAIWTDDVLVSTATAGNQENPEIIADEDDNIYVAWNDNRNGDNDIYLQKINSSGSRVWTSDIRVNPQTSGDQVNPDLVINQDGNLVLVWQDNRNGNYDIIATEYGGDPSSFSVVPNIPLKITGAKKVGSSPVIYKYNQSLSTNSAGELTLTNMEWDTYAITLGTGTGRTIIVSEPPQPIYLAPEADTTVTLNLD